MGVPLSSFIIEAVPQPRERFAAPVDSEFREVYERHAGDILRYAMRCTGRREIAEELASEAFLRLFERWPEIDRDRAGAWLTTAVKNQAIDYWRRRATERRHENDPGLTRPAETSSPDCEQWLEHPALKAEHRACLTLHYVHGMSNPEIVSATGLTANQVKSALQYGLKLLRKALGVAP